MEWQCEQLACANALPARMLGSARQGIAMANTLKAATACAIILVLRRYMQIAMKPAAQDTANRGDQTSMRFESPTSQSILLGFGKPGPSGNFTKGAERP